MQRNSTSNYKQQLWKEGDPTPPQPNTEAISAYNCLTIHWENGEEMTLYYPFLMSVRLRLTAEYNLLELCFTAEKVILKGYSLKLLKRSFASEKPSDIHVNNSRYLLTKIIGQPVVIEAIIEK